MTETSVQITDPARELVELCELLQGGAVHLQGDAYLAHNFEVEAWSTDFYRIVMAIIERIDVVNSLVQQLELDNDFRGEMLGHIGIIRTAFGENAFRNAWQSFGLQRLNRENVQPLKALSGLIRSKVSYKKLSEKDISDLLKDAEKLQEWLQDKNLIEQDFIRGLLIEALDSFRFRLARLKWVGIGYTLDGLREVISAYLLLERAGIDPKVDPNAEAILRKVGALLKTVWSKVQTAKTATETADWLLRAYGAASAIYHGAPVVTALLGAPT
jgi:hypothetical protein